MRRGLAAFGLVGLVAAIMLAVSVPQKLSGFSDIVDVAGELENPIMAIEVGGQSSGTIEIELLREAAPNHVARLVELAEAGAYDGVVFHRVIEGFMAQTGDVQFGRREGGNLARAGTGGSDAPDLRAEFSDISYEPGIVGMARAQHPDSANSQFFIMFEPAPFLNGKYTVIGRVIAGMEVVHKIKRGDPNRNGAVSDPDYMSSVSIRPAEG